MKRLFTSESVTEGHPGKICDQISDAVLDALIAKDSNARVACETTVTTGLVLLVGEISTNGYVDIPKIVRKTINEIGYNNSDFGFDGNTCSVIVSIDEQSPDIALGVSTQHSPDVTIEQIQKDIIEYVVKSVVPSEFLDKDTKYFINPTGRFVIGGP